MAEMNLCFNELSLSHKFLVTNLLFCCYLEVLLQRVKQWDLRLQ